MLFSIPITSKETIVDTPLNCRSLRSFYLFDRYERARKLIDGRDLSGKLTITIDGKEICRDLIAMPFIDSQSSELKMMRGDRDWRRISIPCLKNCDMSEIKITTDDAVLGYEVVFEYSETPVETERFYHIESFPMFIDSGSDATAGAERVIDTHEEAEKIFALQGALFNKDEQTTIEDTLVGFNSFYDSEYYHSHSHHYNGKVSAELKMTISDTLDVLPSKFPVDLISVTDTKMWKDVVYELNSGLSKHPRIRLDAESSISGSINDNPFMFFAIIYLIHECKF